MTIGEWTVVSWAAGSVLVIAADSSVGVVRRRRMRAAEPVLPPPAPVPPPLPPDPPTPPAPNPDPFPEPPHPGPDLPPPPGPDIPPTPQPAPPIDRVHRPVTLFR